VEPGSVTALVEALADLLSDPVRRNHLGDRARSALKETRSLDRYVEQLDQAYSFLGPQPVQEAVG